MKNFEYYNPVRIVFGEGEITKLSSLVPENARVLIVYGGGSIKKNGTFDEVKTALGNRQVFEFSGIEPNPEFDTLMRAVAQIKAENIDFLLAVGGGSVIDGTKFIAAAACFDGDPWDILLSAGQKVTQALPIGTVLTLPATGSEMNRGAVVTRREKNAKLGFHSVHVFPKFSILDPAKTKTLPPRQVANGIVDSFIHIVEQYVTYPVHADVQDGFAESLLKTLIKHGEHALTHPDDSDTRANLMWTATLALNGLIGAGVPQDWATHMIGHELTALYNIDHARTLAIVQFGVWQVMREQKRDKLLQYATNVWGIHEGSEDERIDAAIKATEDFFHRLGIKTRLSDYNLGREAIDAVVQQLTEHGMTTLGEHKAITPEVSREILRTRL